jgi:hypothetical protein
MSWSLAARVAGCFGLLTLWCPTPARAQWYIAAYGGGNHTQSATVKIDQPSAGTSLEFRDVEFTAEPLRSPPYYGWRLGRLIGERRRWGIELEFIHLKAIGQTSRPVAIVGRVGSGPSSTAVDTRAPMNTLVERYSMTHGLNFLLVNVVSRTPFGASSVALVARAGAGPTLPHAETTVMGQAREQYEYGGLGAHGAAGLDIRLHRRLSGVIEYKVTAAKPTIDIVNGTGRTAAVSHQVALGLVFGLWR